MMTTTKVFKVCGITSVAIIVLMIIFKDAKSELFTFLSASLGMTIFFAVSYYFFQNEKETKPKIPLIYKYIFYGISLPMLVFLVEYTREVGDGLLHQGSRVLLGLEVLYILFSWIFNHFKKINQLKNEKTTAELVLLKEQINPHFFFNSLNSLYSLIKKDPDAAQEYVLKLSDMIRFTVYDGKKDTVAIKDELTYLKNFIDLNVTRYHKTIDIQFNEHIENPTTQIPTLLFIILVENAFKHGVEKKTKDAFVHINISQSEDEMYFEITNNFEVDSRKEKPGIGIQNLKNRLNLLFENNYSFDVDIDNDVYCASIKINVS